MRRTVIGATAALLLPAFSVAAQETVEQKFEKYLAGNTTHFVAGGRTGYIYYRTAQRLELWIKETNVSDKGIITFKDADTYCTSWEKMRGGSARCFRLKSISESKMVIEATDNGEVSEATILEGNPQKF